MMCGSPKETIIPRVPGTIHESPQANDNDRNGNEEPGADFDNDLFHTNLVEKKTNTFTLQ